jgi:NAD(P)-dependent dehydrogenase (short-subunit alcohol dehydrogenase family)
MVLEGKRIVVTGGASGIAAGTVAAFARAGASVISLDVNDEPGRAVAAEADAAGLGSVSYLHCDVTDQDEVDAVFAEATSTLGGLDVLAMIAGNEGQKPAEDVRESDIDWLFNVHVKGTMFTNAAAFRSMRETGGSIINTGSGAGVTGYPGSPVYSSAKAAIFGYSRTIAFDWGQYGIRVNTVCPAALTPQSQAHFDKMSPEVLAAYKETYRARIPLGGWLGTVEQTASLYVFLASDASSFLTGQMIGSDGGWTMPR